MASGDGRHVLRIGPRHPPHARARIGVVIPLVLLAAGTLLSCYVFVDQGHPVTVDTWPHLSRTKMVFEALRDGHSPFWSFMFYSGFPALRFYSPLFYFAGGVLAFATRGDILLAVRILLILLQVLSVGAMFLFLWRRTGDVQAASLGSFIYTYVPWRAHHLGGHAAYPQALIYLWLPLMFLFLDRLVTRPNRRDALLLGLVVALGLLSHVIYGAAAVLLLCLMFLLGYRRSTSGGRMPSPVPGLALAASTALALSSFLLVPFLAEYHLRVFPLPSLTIPGPDPRAVLGLLGQPPGARGGYFGFSVVTLLLLAVVTPAQAASRRHSLAAKICLAVTLLVVFVVPRLGSVGSSYALNPEPERFLLFSLFLAAVLVGTTWPAWKTRIGLLRRFSLLGFVALVEIVAMESTGANLIHYYHPKQRFLAARPGAYSFINGSEHSKVVDLTGLGTAVDDYMRTEAYPAMGFVFGGLPTPLGPFYHQFAPGTMLYCYPWINAIAADLGDTTTSVVAARTRKALALMGVSHVLMRPKVLGPPPPDDTSCPALLVKEGIDWDGPFTEPGRKSYLVAGATGFGMVLASNRIRPLGEERVVQKRTLRIAEDWQALLDSLSFVDTLGGLGYIPVTARDHPDSLPGRPRLRVVATSIRNHDATVRFSASQECFLRLAVSYYPELRVKVDGNAVRFGETKDHFIYLRCPGGTHVVRVTAPLTPVRRWTLAASALAAVLMVVGLVTRGAGSKGRST